MAAISDNASEMELISALDVSDSRPKYEKPRILPNFRLGFSEKNISWSDDAKKCGYVGLIYFAYLSADYLVQSTYIIQRRTDLSFSHSKKILQIS